MLGIVILNYNTWELTANCVQSIIDTYEGDYKIYIIDNGSSNNSVEILRNAYINNDKVKIIDLKTNNGYAYGNNRGAEIAIEDGCIFLLISNNDVIFKKYAIDEMHRAFSTIKESILVFPKVYNSDGSLQVKNILTNTPDFFYTVILRSKIQKVIPHFIKNNYLADIESYTKPAFTYYFPGCCFMVRCIDYKNIGMLDENTFLYYEEDILSEKINRTDLGIYYIPTAAVIHLGGASSNVDSWKWSEYIISKLYYWYNYKKINKLICMMNLYLTIFIKGVKNFKEPNFYEKNKLLVDSVKHKLKSR